MLYSMITQQYTGGLMFRLKKYDKSYLRLRVGYSYASIDESFYDLDSDSHGFQLGLGVERKIIGNSRAFLELAYNYQKTA